MVARILIVDDDTDLIAGQTAFLEKKGYQVASAVTIEEGVARAAEFRPDMIIADLMMEHYDSGFVFCKKVRGVAGMEKIPIIMQTAAPRKVGYTFDPGSASGRDWMKVDEVLTKPVPLEHLLGKIEQYLSRSSAPKEGTRP
jgi:DNA-binding response OmpR family regulator